jgi:hypothetical protein
MFSGKPALPKSNREGRSFSPRIRLTAIQEIEMQYEERRAFVPRLATMLNACSRELVAQFNLVLSHLHFEQSSMLKYTYHRTTNINQT